MRHALFVAHRIAWAAVLCILLLHASASTSGEEQDAGPSLPIGTRVMPRSNAEVRDRDTVIHEDQLPLPFIVQAIDGELRRVGGHDKGWVKRSDVVDLDGAISYYTGLIDRGDNLVWAYEHRAITWAILEQPDLSLSDFAEEIRLKPGALAYRHRARAWVSKKDYRRAIGDLNHAIELDRNDPKAYTNRGVTRCYMKDYDKAIEDFNQALRLDPTHATAYTGRGGVAMYKGDYNKAIADYSQAIGLDPNNGMTYSNRGGAWASKKELGKAMADFESAIKVDPMLAEAYDNRCYLLLLTKDYDKAVADCDKVIKLKPNWSGAFLTRGNLWYIKKSYGKAVADFNQALRLNPNSDAALRQIAWFYATCPDARFRDGARAAEAAENACKLTDWASSKSLEALAAADAEAQDFDSAVKWQLKAIELCSPDLKSSKDARDRCDIYRQKQLWRCATELPEARDRFNAAER